MAAISFSAIRPGDPIPSQMRRPTALQIFRFSAVTWNAHRIHFEKEYAQLEGYPDILVQAHLHAAFLAQMVTDWAGPDVRVVEFGWTNRRYAVAEVTLLLKGKVARVWQHAGRSLVACDLYEENEAGDLLVQGSATLLFPPS